MRRSSRTFIAAPDNPTGVSFLTILLIAFIVLLLIAGTRGSPGGSTKSRDTKGTREQPESSSFWTRNRKEEGDEGPREEHNDDDHDGE